MAHGARAHESPIASLEVQERSSVDAVRRDGAARLYERRDALDREAADVTALGTREPRRDGLEHERRIRGAVLTRPSPQRTPERVSLIVFTRLFTDFGGEAADRRK